MEGREGIIAWRLRIVWKPNCMWRGEGEEDGGSEPKERSRGTDVRIRDAQQDRR